MPISIEEYIVVDGVGHITFGAFTMYAINILVGSRDATIVVTYDMS